jgi:hypothetical protein
VERLQTASQATVLGGFARAAGGANPSNTIAKQFVSTYLAAQTISGTVKGRILVFENATSNNYGAQLRIYSYRPSDASTQVIYELDVYTPGSATPPEFVATTATNRKWPETASAGNLTSTTVVNGDVLVVEIGFRASAAASANATFRFGEDGAGGDAPEDETSTGSTLNPWIEFSGTISFWTPASIVSDSRRVSRNTLMRM